uniref:SLF2 protein n=1 Tax=Calidris pygmaea TaxID=425635 RepID=A0A8C3JM45_9CHAR
GGVRVLPAAGGGPFLPPPPPPRFLGSPPPEVPGPGSPVAMVVCMFYLAVSGSQATGQHGGVPAHDRTVLGSPDRGNVKDAGIGLSVLCAEHFENKTSSPKKVRRKKMPDQTPNTSPLVDAFCRGIKEKKDTVKILENSRACKALSSLYPKAAIRKILIPAGSRSSLLAKKDKALKSEQERNEKCLSVTRAPFSCGNSWEQEADCMDLEDTSSDSDKWVSPEADTRKACARNNGTVNSTSLCQNPGLPMKFPCIPADSEFRLSLEALRRERKRKKHRMKQSKPVKPFSGTSVSHQISSGQSKQIDFPGKRKRVATSVDADSSNQPELSLLNDPAFSRSSAECKNRRSDFVKNILLKSACGSVLQLMETVALPSPGKNNHITAVDTKENQLQVANSCFFLEKSLPFSQENSTALPSLYHLTQTKGVESHLQNAGLSQVLDATEEDGKRPERRTHNKPYSIHSGNSFATAKDKASESTSDSCSAEGSGKLALSEETGKSVPRLLSFKEGCTDSGHTSSQLSGELNVESTCTDKSKLNGKSKSSFDSEDENLECSLDDDDDNDDDVVFVPLQEILSSSPKPQAGTLEESCLDSFSQETMSPLLKLHVSA